MSAPSRNARQMGVFVLAMINVAAVLALVASTLAFVVTPQLAQNRLFMFVTMMVVFWATPLPAP